MLDPNFLSAEMTAFLRSTDAHISNDSISQHMVSNVGISNTYQFIAMFDYPLIARLISVRAGFFLTESLRLLATGKYDACISIASGFSLLTSLIKQQTKQPVVFVDCDLQKIMDERIKRMNTHPMRSGTPLNTTEHYVLDILKLYQNKIAIKTQFSHYKSPLFVIEGLSYFLPKDVSYWLVSQLLHFTNAAIMFDYCPKQERQSNPCMQRLMDNLPGFLCHGEAIFDPREIGECLNAYQTVKRLDIANAECELLKKDIGSQPLLTDANQFLPTEIIVATV